MLIPAAASLIGGAMSSSSAERSAATQAAAAERAAESQLQAAREANQLQAGIYRQGLGIQAPQIRGGQLALSALMSGLGLGPATPGAQVAPVGAPAGPTYTNAQGQTVDAQGNVVRDATYGIGSIPVGATAEEMAAAGSPLTGTFKEQFTGQDIYKDPSYQFRLEEGLRALRAQQAAGGNRFGGQAMKDITNYAQGAASQEFGSAYNRFMANKAALYDRLSSLAGLGTRVGSEAASGGLTAGQQIGQNIIGGQRAASDLLTGAAAARAGGLVGSTGAIVGGINQGLNNWYTQQYIDKFKQSMPTTTAQVPLGTLMTGPEYGQFL